MRITIDTDLQAIIVPESYYMQVDKLNEVIEEAGGTKLDYTQYIKSCFDKAYNTQIVRQNDVAKMRGTKKRKAVTPDEVKEFHRLYEQYGSYAEVARRTGRSASTIGKYIRMAGMTKAHKHAVEQTIGKK